MGSNGGNLIQLEEINRIWSKLEKDIDDRKISSARYRKFYNTLHGISINAAIAGATIAVLPNPITAIAMVATNVTLAAVSTVTSLWSKLVNRRLKTYTKLGLMSNNTLIRINQLLSEGLKDGQISDLDYNAVLEEYQKFFGISNNMKDFSREEHLLRKVRLKRKLMKHLNLVD